MDQVLDFKLIGGFLQALRPGGPWTPAAIDKKDDGQLDLSVVCPSNLDEIKAFCLIHQETNLYYQANETKPVWNKARIMHMERGRLDADYGFAERSREYCGAHP